MGKYQELRPLSAQELGDLNRSIRETGRVEVPVLKDENGDIIDGHHRAMIADSLGIGYPVEIRSGLTEVEKYRLIVDIHKARRQMTEYDMVVLGERIEAAIAEDARKRQGHGATAPGRSATTVAERPERTVDEVARITGLGSGRTYERHKQTLQELKDEPDGDQLIGHLASGDWDIPEARKELRTRHPDRYEPAPKPTALPQPPEFTPEEQGNIDSFSNAFARAEAPHLFADDLVKATGSALKHMRMIQRLPEGRLAAMATENADLTTELRKALDIWLELAAVCRSGLGDVGATLRRIG